MLREIDGELNPFFKLDAVGGHNKPTVFEVTQTLLPDCASIPLVPCVAHQLPSPDELSLCPVPMSWHELFG